MLILTNHKQPHRQRLLVFLLLASTIAMPLFNRYCFSRWDQSPPAKTSKEQKPPAMITNNLSRYTQTSQATVDCEAGLRGTNGWPCWSSSYGGEHRNFVSSLPLMQLQPIANRCGDTNGAKSRTCGTKFPPAPPGLREDITQKSRSICTRAATVDVFHAALCSPRSMAENQTKKRGKKCDEKAGQTNWL